MNGLKCVMDVPRFTQRVLKQLNQQRENGPSEKIYET